MYLNVFKCVLLCLSVYKSSPNRACSMGFWRVYKAGPPSLASLALDVRENNEFRKDFIRLLPPYYCSAEVALTRALQP